MPHFTIISGDALITKKNACQVVKDLPYGHGGGDCWNNTPVHYAQGSH